MEDKSRAHEIEDNQQTCDSALRSCQQDKAECHPLLEDVMMWCEHSHCEPDRCRTSLQNFYSRVSISRRLEVAFCVCRQKDFDGQCLTAMRELHPTCAERQAGRGEKKCHEMAKHCRENPSCRDRLIEYEKNCSADAVTGKCIVSHRACQFAVTKILGTELHASCVCKGTDFLHQSDCYSYQKLLWSNPCVIESHLALQEELSRGDPKLDEIFTKAPLPTTTQPPKIPTTEDTVDMSGNYGANGYEKSVIPQPPTSDRFSNRYNRPTGIRLGGSRCPPSDPMCSRMKQNKPGIIIGGGRRNGFNLNQQSPIGFGKGDGQGGHRPSPDGSHRERPVWGEGGHQYQGPYNANYPSRGVNSGPTRYPGYPYNQPNPNNNQGHNNNNNNMMVPVEGGMQNNFVSTDSTPSTSNPTRFCIMQVPNTPKKLKIEEGGVKRIYETYDCSILCSCPVLDKEKKLLASCKSLGCVSKTACNTTDATFPHDHPSYERYRGECVCYSGKFICQRPDPSKYNGLGPGVYLLLGYSKNEMEALKGHTNKSEIEALFELENLLVKKYGFKCRLISKEHIGDNFILAAELLPDHENIIPSSNQHHRAKQECAKPLEVLAQKINERPRHPDVRQDAYLSMFILAELHVNIPEAQVSKASRGSHLGPSWLVALVAICLLLLMCHEDLGEMNSLKVFSERLVRKSPLQRLSMSGAGGDGRRGFGTPS